MTTGARSEVRVVAVSRLANYINGLISRDKKLRWLGIRGEISNWRAQPNGNVYFDLKDRDALLSCLAFSEASATFPKLSNGDQIVAYGSVTTFAKGSKYQLRVFQVAPEGGSGALHAVYLALKHRLQTEGLFSQARKRILPAFPFRVALVTSQSAEGARDFITQARVRAPHVEIVVVPTPVQGERAAPEIARAIIRASSLNVDMVVVARGGGSFEDLFAFNDERVVRAVADSRIPTVSAIGHEGDAPLIDFVADHRAPTPSTAAQTILPRRDDLLETVAGRERTLLQGVDRVLAARRQNVDVVRKDLNIAAIDNTRRLEARLNQLVLSLLSAAPDVQLERRRARYQQLRDSVSNVAQRYLRANADRLFDLEARLSRSGPRMRSGPLPSAILDLRHRLDFAVYWIQENRYSRIKSMNSALAQSAPSRKLDLLRWQFLNQDARLTGALPRLISQEFGDVQSLHEKIRRAAPTRRIDRSYRDCDAARLRLLRAMQNRIGRMAAASVNLATKLDGLNPDAILQRGYAIVSAEDGQPLRDARDVPSGARIKARLAHGELVARVESGGNSGGR